MEIEERAFVDSFDNISAKLEKRGYEQEEVVNLTDAYYCPSDYDSVEQIRMDNPGSYGLRLRKKEAGDQTEVTMNCKVIKWENDHNAFDEYETEIGSFEETDAILNAIGFQNFCTLEKTRTKYVSPAGELTVNLEDIDSFPSVIEVEMTGADQVDHKRRMVREVLYDLGVAEDEIIDDSITLLYMEENAFQEA